MKMYSTQEIQQLLNALPNSPENAQLYAMLVQMLNESKV